MRGILCPLPGATGGLFEKPTPKEHLEAFRYAVEQLNERLGDDPEVFKFAPLVVNDIDQDRPFNILKTACGMLKTGVVAFLGPNSFDNINIVQSVCDTKEIPYLITRWNNWPVRHGTEINFFPHPPLLARAYFDIVSQWGWKTFTLLYEDDESLLRTRNLVEMAKGEGIQVQIEQLDYEQTGNYRTTLKKMKKSDQRFFVLDCSVDILQEVLSQLQQIRLVNPEKKLVQQIARELLSQSHSQTDNEVEEGSNVVEELPDLFLAMQMRTETALVIDAVNMFANTLNERKKESSVPVVNNSTHSFPCDVVNSWEHGLSVVNMLKSSSYEGVTGLTKFNTEGYRSEFELGVFFLKEGGIVEVGTWNSSRGLNLTALPSQELINDEDSLRNKSFTVIITLTEPYGMLKNEIKPLLGNDRYEGFGIDLIQKLSEMEGFNYTFIVREDKKNGNLDPKTNKWTGMIGDLLEYRADLAITDFTITSDREEAVDFTSPFMSLDTWMALVVSFFVVSIALFIIGRLVPDEWTNPFPCIQEPEYLVNQFSFFNSVWFTTGSLMAQGSEIAPIAMSTRMVAGMWWFFCLIIVASYTANLAAFLATENPVELITDLQSLYENKHQIKYGAKEGGATLRFFTTAEEGTLFRKVGQHMIDHPENVKENDEGVLRAVNEKYAFFMESTSIEYAVQRHCTLKQYGGLLDEKGYGIAMRKESFYRKRLSLAILKLQSSGVIDELKRKWWQERRGGGQCEGKTEVDDADPLALVNVQGCFFVTIYGTIIAVILVIIEHLLYVVRVSKKNKLPFIKVFMAELRAYLDFNSDTKPVVTKEVLEDSSGSQEGMQVASEEQVEEEETKAKSPEPVSQPSKSPSKEKVSRSASKSDTKGTPRGNSTNGRPYGFVIPPSAKDQNRFASAEDV
nr:unnamed protein product [Callosobruchus analis]